MSSTSSQWFRKRMDKYSVELSKSFMETKARVQRGLEQLKLKNAETLKRIPSFRGSFRGSFRASGKKQSKKTKSPRKAKSPKKNLQSYSPQPSDNSSELNSTYCISRKSYNPSIFVDQSSGSELEETEITAEHTLLSSTLKLPLNMNHSFPRMSRSRKIENINIVFDTPFPSPVPNHTSTPKKQRIETCHQANLGVMHKDTFDMENLCSVMAKIHAKQKRVKSVRKPPHIRRIKKDAILRKSLMSSFERHTSTEEVSCSDSELAMSTDISLKSYDSSDDDEPKISSPLPIARVDYELDDPDVYWISKKIIDLPRTSSRLSMQSCSSYGGGGVSPGLSPIMNIRANKPAEPENQLKRAWGMTYKLKKDKDVAKKFFSINEAPVIDSGYSDRSGATSRATSSRATMYELQNNRWRVTPSPTTSSSPSPTPPTSVPAKIDEDLVPDSKRFHPSGQYVLKSFYV